MIDIAVPRDIDAAVIQLDNVYLYNVDDLQTIANDHLQQRRGEIVKCEAIIEAKVKGLLERLPTNARGNNGAPGAGVALGEWCVDL